MLRSLHEPHVKMNDSNHLRHQLRDYTMQVHNSHAKCYSMYGYIIWFQIDTC